MTREYSALQYLICDEAALGNIQTQDYGLRERTS